MSNPAAVRRGPAIRSSMRSMSRTRFLMFGLFVSRAAIEPPGRVRWRAQRRRDIPTLASGDSLTAAAAGGLQRPCVYLAAISSGTRFRYEYGFSVAGSPGF